MARWVVLSCVLVLSAALLLGCLSAVNVRLTDADLAASPSRAHVTQFYDAFGALLMNDLYHRTFEEPAMDIMIEECCFESRHNVVEIGPGGGFLAEKILRAAPGLHYTGADMSAAMVTKATARLKPFIDGGGVRLLHVNDSLSFLAAQEASVDRFVFTYVLDLLPPADIDDLAKVLREKLKGSNAKVCMVNLTHGFTGLSRLVTNVWQLLYRHLGGAAVGGCRPIQASDYFLPRDGFRVDSRQLTVSAGLPSEVSIISAGGS